MSAAPYYSSAVAERASRGSGWILTVLAALSLVACAGRLPGVATPDLSAARLVYVISNGFHTALVLPRAQVSSEVWPEQAELGPAPYLEVGWGDKAAYLADRITIRLALGAAFGSSSSALQVAGLDVSPAERTRDLEVAEVRVTAREFDDLTRFIRESYARDAGGSTIRLSRGYTDNSAFYLATGRYHLLNTCNTWTARALRAAGCSIASAFTLTASQLVQQALDACKGIRLSGM